VLSLARVVALAGHKGAKKIDVAREDGRTCG